MTHTPGPTITGTWRLVAERAWDETGAPFPAAFGPMGIGIATFTPEGRMMAVLSDGRPETPDAVRAYVSYIGRYSFDGSRLVTVVDGASEPRLREADQIRDARFEGARLILRPPTRNIRGRQVTRELEWERVTG